MYTHTNNPNPNCSSSLHSITHTSHQTPAERSQTNHPLFSWHGDLSVGISETPLCVSFSITGAQILPRSPVRTRLWAVLSSSSIRFFPFTNEKRRKTQSHFNPPFRYRSFSPSSHNHITQNKGFQLTGWEPRRDGSLTEVRLFSSSILLEIEHENS